MKVKQQLSMMLDIELVSKLDVIAKKENRSRSYIANRMLNEAARDE